MLYQPFEKSGILIHTLSSAREATQYAYTLLRNNVTKKNLLLLSGGTNANILYRLVAQFTTIVPKTVALIDEIFGPPFHYRSNELALQETGIIDHFSRKGVPFFRILGRSASPEGTARLYGNHLTQLYQSHKQKIAILELHKNGQLAGILPNKNNWSNPAFSVDSDFVTTYQDPNQKETTYHITTTLPALEQIDVFVVMATGKTKAQTVRDLFGFDKRQLTRFPAVFLQNRNHATVHLITDQKVS